MPDNEPLPRIIDISSHETAADPIFSARVEKNKGLLDALHPAAAEPVPSVRFDINDDPMTPADYEGNSAYYYDLLQRISDDRNGKRVSAEVRIVRGEQHDTQFAKGKWTFQGRFGNPTVAVILVSTLDHNEQAMPAISQIHGYLADQLPPDLQQLYDSANLPI